MCSMAGIRLQECILSSRNTIMKHIHKAHKYKAQFCNTTWALEELTVSQEKMSIGNLGARLFSHIERQCGHISIRQIPSFLHVLSHGSLVHVFQCSFYVLKFKYANLLKCECWQGLPATLDPFLLITRESLKVQELEDPNIYPSIPSTYCFSWVEGI